MQVQQLSVHDRRDVEGSLLFLTHQNTPICDDCGFAHGVLDILAMAALGAESLNVASTEKLFKDALNIAIESQQKQPGIRSLPDCPDSFQDMPGYCDECKTWHPMFDTLALIILCGLKTKEEIEAAFQESIRYVMSFCRPPSQQE